MLGSDEKFGAGKLDLASEDSSSFFCLIFMTVLGVEVFCGRGLNFDLSKFNFFLSFYTSLAIYVVVSSSFWMKAPPSSIFAFRTPLKFSKSILEFITLKAVAIKRAES